MLFELSIIPLGGDTHLSGEIAEVIKIIDESGHPYQLTPSGTCIEGDWEAIVPLIKKCHDRLRGHSRHVITMVKIEDEEGERNKLSMNVKSVEDKIGKKLGRTA
ncbi:MAG: MTH1187 family thiamine-binding protein [Syntrophales bacterium]|nr:MTH1187 family thiamine-binding protein [Syntrophales bacterium]